MVDAVQDLDLAASTMKGQQVVHLPLPLLLVL